MVPNERKWTVPNNHFVRSSILPTASLLKAISTAANILFRTVSATISQRRKHFSRLRGSCRVSRVQLCLTTSSVEGPA
ncbi:hypothetical protein ACEPAH_3025 [Sanghuangporus vaninii]